MGSVMTKLEKEDEYQAKWRKICTNKFPQNGNSIASFSELHILRGGRGRICACPSLIWPDNYSLVVQAEGLPSYFGGIVNCDVLVIWNFNSRNLHEDSNIRKVQGTSYIDILPHLLRALISANLQPQFINFQDCDFSKVEESLFKDFLYSQLARLEDITFEGCEAMPVRANIYEESAKDDLKRKISVQSVQSLKEEGITGRSTQFQDIQE